MIVKNDRVFTTVRLESKNIIEMSSLSFLYRNVEFRRFSSYQIDSAKTWRPSFATVDAAEQPKRVANNVARVRITEKQNLSRFLFLLFNSNRAMIFPRTGNFVQVMFVDFVSRNQISSLGSSLSVAPAVSIAYSR